MITAAYVASLLSYDRRTGEIRWRVTRGGNAVAGQRAGYLLANGYRSIVIDGRRYLAHRLAHLLMTGEWPEHQVDHRNRRRDSNRWRNLRPATSLNNHANASRRSDNTSGLKGVSRHKGKWRAVIGIAGKQRELGHFTSKKNAGAAYRQAALALFGEFAHP